MNTTYLEGSIPNEVLSGALSYRVSRTDGTWGVNVRRGRYHFATRMSGGKVYTVYIGVAGQINNQDVTEALYQLRGKLHRQNKGLILYGQRKI